MEPFDARRRLKLPDSASCVKHHLFQMCVSRGLCSVTFAFHPDRSEGSRVLSLGDVALRENLRFLATLGMTVDAHLALP